jgi:probable rRNA maturation factor
MMHRVHLQGVPQPYARPLRRAVLCTLRQSGAGPGSLTLRLTDEGEIRRLNALYAGADHATDVLSFSDGGPDDEGGGAYFGDIVIALSVAEANAGAAGHPALAELSLLAVHGTLHLLGYDHASEAGRQAMWLHQDQILEDLGCPIRSPQGEA